MTAYFQTAGGAMRRPRPWHVAVIVTAVCWPLSGMLPSWLPYAAALVTGFLMWRRWGEYRRVRAAAGFAFSWDARWPDDRLLIECSDRELGNAVDSAAYAASQANLGVGIWFGGDGSAADPLYAISRRATAEQSARATGYALPGGRSSARDTDDLDLPPSADDAAPVAPDAAGWARKLTQKSEDW